MTNLQRIEELVGKAFFVPVRPCTKEPVVTYKERPRDKTQSAAYRQLLEENNIAVYLGEKSDGLCAIDFDTEGFDIAFLSANPRLNKTLRSQGARGQQVWIRITGEYPDSVSPVSKEYEWRANGRLSTIWGTHPNGNNYRFLNEAIVVELKFDEIIWPEGWPVPGKVSVEEAMTKEFGPPMHVGEKGGGWINQGFMVQKFHVEHDVLWDDVSGRFYRYHAGSGLWKHVPDPLIQAGFAEDIRKMIVEAKKAADEDGRFDSMFKLVSQSLLKNLSEMLKGSVLKENPFHRPSHVVHALNGMVDLSERPFAFKPFNKGFFSRNQCAVRYDPSAQCPNFIQNVLSKALSEQDGELLQRWFGMAVLGRNMAQSIMLMIGGAGTGKGTIVNLATNLVGRDNCYQLRTEQLTSRFELSFYHDKSLLYGADVSPDFLNCNEAHVLKSLTGGDMLSGEIKGSSHAHNLIGDYNVVLTSNSRLLLKIQGDSGAWLRRLKMVEFNRPPSENVIPNYASLLMQQEGPGILNWAIEGAVKTIQNSKDGNPMPVTTEQRAKIENLITESDSVRWFIANCVSRSPFPLDSISSRDLYMAYFDSCENRGWTPTSQRSFEMRASDLLIQIHRAELHRHHKGDTDSPRGYKGIVVKPQ